MSLWEGRLRRAEALERRRPEAGAILRLYRAVLGLQSASDPAAVPESRLPGILEVLRREGPPAMARWATADEALGASRAGDPLARWAVRLAEQPSRRPVSAPTEDARVPARCPACGEAPLVSLLRDDPEAEAVRRTLVCPLCAGEWGFPRALCPGCGEERPEKLPRFTAAEIPWIRIDACDACGTYLKSLDLSKDPEADPAVDDLATPSLDLVARDWGYAKAAPNLAGL